MKQIRAIFPWATGFIVGSAVVAAAAFLPLAILHQEHDESTHAPAAIPTAPAGAPPPLDILVDPVPPLPDIAPMMIVDP